MKTMVRSAGWVVLIFLFAAPLSAQWPDYPTRGVPRTDDGEPDLSASTPRTSWGTVDFTGLWESSRGNVDD